MDGFLGTIMMCGFRFTPLNYAACNGALMPINQNAALYSLLGVSFGGSANTTFGLPDLRGRVPMSQGQGSQLTFREIGDTFGNEMIGIEVTEAQMPPHYHGVVETEPGESFNFSSTATLRANKSTNNSSTPENSFNAVYKSGPIAQNIYASTADTTMNSTAIDVETIGALNANSLVTTQSGGGHAISIPLFQPSLVLNFVICTQGQYPSKS